MGKKPTTSGPLCPQPEELRAGTSPASPRPSAQQPPWGHLCWGADAGGLQAASREQRAVSTPSLLVKHTCPTAYMHSSGCRICGGRTGRGRRWGHLRAHSRDTGLLYPTESLRRRKPASDPQPSQPDTRLQRWGVQGHRGRKGTESKWEGTGRPYLPHPALPAHALQASRGQDDGAELLQLVQLLQPRAKVPPLRQDAKDQSTAPPARTCPS